MNRRLTFTFSREDVAAAVQREALRRGCDPQAVINWALERHFIECAEQRLSEQLTITQGVVRHLTGQQGTPAARPHVEPEPFTPVPMPVAVAQPRQGIKKNPWEH